MRLYDNKANKVRIKHEKERNKLRRIGNAFVKTK